MKIQRHLAPTAAPISWSDIGRGLIGLFRGQRYRAGIEAEMKDYFGVKHLFLVSSGKAALTTILRALAADSPRRKVIIPAFTCFSVPSAVLQAGCRVELCDVVPDTLDFDFSRLEAIVDKDTLCIVSPHLLGQVADIRRAQAIAQPHHVPVVEDAAQAMGIKFGGRWLGAQGEIGFFSLGRGKNVTAGSGGVILTNSDDLARKVTSVYQQLSESSLADQITNAAMAVAMKLLIVPRLYWFPAGLPFLGLGETRFYRDFPIHRLDGMRAGLLCAWRKRLERSNNIRMQQTQRYHQQFPADLKQLEPRLVAGTTYLRIPVVMPTALQKRDVCASSLVQGLGISPLYPTPISEIPELRGAFDDQQFRGASVLAERLVTLPVHNYVEEGDIGRICEMLHAVVSKVSSINAQHSQADS